MSDEPTRGFAASESSRRRPVHPVPGTGLRGPGLPGRRRVPLLLTLAGFAVLAYVLDQLTKWWVSSTMTDGQITPVLPQLLSWHYIRNSGAAFSIGENVTWLFTIVMAVVAIGIVVQARKLGSVWWSVAMGMLLGGALGNLTDRLFREPSFGMGHVVDFIALPNFAIFNIADSSVVGSVILICILTLKGIPFGGRAAPAQPAEEGPAAAGTEGKDV
ncbi:signal peptidase II [Paenarthrobacter sp. PH39-S1]|uniref:signal peptidase II n=1 Tax=Paenarthrobacter sp. PH39-S1 TaxID=3046204 RepID=UPI0024BA4FE0|nr:signal peptidase II [Paenarthrobacter sp. PH39-S1]MDJ0356933.1 signal peptidase II [Paenarthrobacter sp. PH39-S1]